MYSNRAALAILLLGAAACGDARIRKLDENISRDSALKILAEGAAPGDTQPHIYRESKYLVNGKNYRVAYFTSTDRKRLADSSANTPLIEFEDLTPLVFVNDTLKAWGWDRWEVIADSLKIPVPVKK